MADDELAAIRAQRMQQMQAGSGQGPSEQDLESQKAAKEGILSRILNHDARTRLQSIKAVKPEKAAMVEATLIQMYQRGQIRGEVDEDSLKQFLAQVNQQTAKTTKVKFARREMDDDDDDLDYRRPGDSSDEDD